MWSIPTSRNSVTSMVAASARRPCTAAPSLIVLALALGCASRGGRSPAPDGTSTGAPGALASSGVCGFTAPVTYGPPGADGMVAVPPGDPNIFYMGRVDCKPAGPAFAFPAVSVRVRRSYFFSSVMTMSSSCTSVPGLPSWLHQIRSYIL